MKKTLIALAAVAATGASFAQVTLSGEIGYGWQKSLDGTAAMRQTDGSVTLKASEDLGGGLKVMGATTFDLKGRDAVSAENTTLTVAGGFGALTLGAIEACQWGTNAAGAPISLGNGYDGYASHALVDSCGNIDVGIYTLPKLVEGVTLKVIRAEAGADAVGSGTGSVGANVVRAEYKAGAIYAGVDYTSFTEALDGESRTRLTASYDLGMAKVGYAMSDRSYIDDAVSDFTVTVPMGAITAGFMYAKRGDNKGTYFGMDYALSKRTKINLSYGSADVNGNDENESRLKLYHTF